MCNEITNIRIYAYFSGIFFYVDLIRQSCDRGSMHKKKEVGGGEKGPVGVVQKQMCTAQTAHKVWKVRLLLRRRTIAHVGLQRAQKPRFKLLTVSLAIRGFRATSRVCGPFYSPHIL